MTVTNSNFWNKRLIFTYHVKMSGCVLIFSFLMSNITNTRIILVVYLHV